MLLWVIAVADSRCRVRRYNVSLGAIATAVGLGRPQQSGGGLRRRLDRGSRRLPLLAACAIGALLAFDSGVPETRAASQPHVGAAVRVEYGFALYHPRQCRGWDWVAIKSASVVFSVGRRRVSISSVASGAIQMRAEQRAGLGVENGLHQPLALAERDRLAVGRIGEAADFQLMT